MKYSLFVSLSWRKADAATPCLLDVAGFRRLQALHVSTSLAAMFRQALHVIIGGGVADTLITLAMPLSCSNMCCVTAAQ